MAWGRSASAMLDRRPEARQGTLTRGRARRPLRRPGATPSSRGRPARGCAPRRPARAPSARSASSAIDGRGQAGGVALRHQQPVLAVGDDGADAAGRRGDDRRARGQRLQHDVGQAVDVAGVVADRGHDGDVGGGQGQRHRLVRRAGRGSGRGRRRRPPGRGRAARRRDRRRRRSRPAAPGGARPAPAPRRSGTRSPSSSRTGRP